MARAGSPLKRACGEKARAGLAHQGPHYRIRSNPRRIERKKAAHPDSRLCGSRIERSLMRLLMIFFHPFVLLHGLLLQLLKLGLLFGSEHTVDLVMA